VWLLRVAGKIGEGMGAPAYAVGGLVRDLLTGAGPADVDLVVEGDGVAFARRLAEEIGGTVLVHRSFGTASIEGGRAPAGAGLDGVALGRVDVASARREHYPAAGALPEVEPASLLEDLRRRDFSVNAMALALSPDRFGRLLDPLGGQADVRCRRLRALHPLSFVEDPTRVFRAARYATRLGFRPDAATVAAIRLAVERPGYVALSGRRLWHEIELAAVEPRARLVFELLVRWKATRLWNLDGASPRHLPAAEQLERWAKSAGVAVDPAELGLLALTLGRPAEVVERSLDRLALAGEARARVAAGTAWRWPARRAPASKQGCWPGRWPAGSRRSGCRPARWASCSTRRPRRPRSRPGCAAGRGRGGGSSGTWPTGARCGRGSPAAIYSRSECRAGRAWARRSACCDGTDWTAGQARWPRSGNS
jgi:hypothetical protein